MKTRLNILALSALSFSPMALSGCETFRDHPVATGAVVGGAAGAVTGAAIDDENRWRGGAIGAGAGAAVGAGAGYVIDKETDKNKDY